MAIIRWVGSSLNRRQNDTITCSGTGDWVSTDAITLAIDNVSVSITLGSGQTDAQVATTIYQAWEGVTLTDTAATLSGFSIADGGIKNIPQFSEMTATNPSAGVVSLLSNGSGALAGKPWTLGVTVSVTGDEDAAETTAITPTSQYHADQADNYSGNALPTGGSDTLIFDHGNVDVRWGLDYATTLTAITKYKAYTGNVGLPETNADNSAKPYHEYRTTYLTCTGCTTVNLEVGEGPGSGRFKLNTGSAAASAINIFGRGTRIDSAVPCILWKGTNASNTVNNIAGDLGIAFYGGETATVATLVTGDPTNAASTVCGSGCTLTTVTLNGGVQETNSAMTTANQNGGNWTHKLGTVTTLNMYGGTHYPNGAATYTTLNLYGGTFDASKGNASFTITNTVNLYRGSRYIDPQGRSGNIVFKLWACGPADVTIVLPANKTYTLS
jgi:hypothetical protein